MVHVNRTFPVSVDPATALAYLRDFAHAEAWDPGTVSCTRAGAAADDPVEVGARWHNTSTFLGRKTQLEYTLEAVTQETLRFVGRNKSATSIDEITVKPDGAGTSITYDANVTFNGLAKLADPVAGVMFERLAKETVERMTTTLEALPS